MQVTVHPRRPAFVAEAAPLPERDVPRPVSLKDPAAFVVNPGLDGGRRLSGAQKICGELGEKEGEREEIHIQGTGEAGDRERERERKGRSKIGAGDTPRERGATRRERETPQVGEKEKEKEKEKERAREPSVPEKIETF